MLTSRVESVVIMAVLSAVGAKVWLFHLKSFRSAVRSLSLNFIKKSAPTSKTHSLLRFLLIAWSSMN